MFRTVFAALNASRQQISTLLYPKLTGSVQKFIQPSNNFHYLTSTHAHKLIPYTNKSLLENESVQNILNNTERSVTKFSLRKGKRKSVKAVLKRFYRLDWGIWIRTRQGRHKKIWKKSGPLRKRLQEHIFVNATQSTLLDNMTTKYWHKPKYYVDDPYEPYHEREEFYITRKKPL